jgi:hypothetical protein
VPEPVVVIGAGPYGIATAVHLRAAGVPVRCFGDPFSFWRDHMPSRMLLRSPRRATHIADPDRRLSIDRYEDDTGRRCRDPSLTLEEFLDYAGWFRRLGVPDVEQRLVRKVACLDGAYGVTLEDGEQIGASRVVVAAGLGPFGRRPEVFESLSASRVSHASDHADLSVFAGQRVAVIGSGQSALESAALLSERGAEVEVLARASEVRWLSSDDGNTRTPGSLIPLPPTAVGGRLSGWIAAMPDAFRRLPQKQQEWVSRRCTRPAGSGWLRPRLNRVAITCGRFTTKAEERGAGVWLQLDDGSERVVDHVLLGTGYAVDIARYPFLPPELIAKLDTVAGYPLLRPGFEASLAGLHFVGASAARSFGPVMRFVVGTWYAAPAVAHLAQNRRQPLLRFAF